MSAELGAAIAADIEGWDAIEDHRTGTAGDLRTAQWLADLARDAGAAPVIDRFPLRRWALRHCCVEADGTTAAGVPLFDGGSTDANGVEAPLVALPSDVPGIGIGAFGNDAGAAANAALSHARQAAERPALVAVSKMNSTVPGLALQNADRFAQQPRTPPTLQVATEHEAWLGEAAAAGALAKVTAHVDFEDALGSNVRVRIAGRDPALRPLVVMTPKSSWWVSTAERGGGIAVWLALLRRFAGSRPARDMLFLATSGHELGHLGLDSCLAADPTLGREAKAWIHLGANFASRGGRIRLQASDPHLQGLAKRTLAAADAPPDDLTPQGQRPGGEARNIHDLGGSYVSLLGSNAWFHHPDDRWPDTVDVARTARLTEAMLEVGAHLAEADADD